MGAVRSVIWRSIRKKVARTRSRASRSSRSGVVVGLGPSSKVRKMVGGLVRAICHTARRPANASRTNGAGAVWARTATAAMMAIRITMRFRFAARSSALQREPHRLPAAGRADHGFEDDDSLGVRLLCDDLQLQFAICDLQFAILKLPL